METFQRYLPFVRGIHRSPVNSPHKGQWGRALMFSLICAWINDWVNNGEAGDLRCYRAHYVVTVIDDTCFGHSFEGQVECHCITWWSAIQHMTRFCVSCLNTLRPTQNGRHFPDDIFESIFLNENIWIILKIWLKFVLKIRINNIPALVQIMAWRRAGDKPLSELMMV